jgi:hypothetical protein
MIEYEEENSAADYYGWFWNEKNVHKKMVPRILTDDQKRRIHISFDSSHNAEMSDRVISGDETWCFQYESERKRQTMQWRTQN